MRTFGCDFHSPFSAEVWVLPGAVKRFAAHVRCAAFGGTEISRGDPVSNKTRQILQTRTGDLIIAIKEAASRINNCPITCLALLGSQFSKASEAAG